MASYTSFGTRKALGKRYATDPALLLEMERLNQEYALAPAREARAVQSQQYADTMAFNERQAAENRRLREEEGRQAALSGMVGTAGNALSTAATLRYMTMNKGEPFFGKTIGSLWDGGKERVSGMFGDTPQAGQQVQPQRLVNPATIDTSAGGIGSVAPSGYSGGTLAGGNAYNGLAVNMPVSFGAGVGGGTLAQSGTFGDMAVNMPAGGATTGMTSGAGTALSGAGSALSTAAPYYALAKAGGTFARNNFPEGTVPNKIGQSLDRPLGVEQYWANEVGAPNEIQTALDVLNPLAPAERVISDSIGTVICTELHRQGKMPDDIYEADKRFGEMQDVETMVGYHAWGEPVACAMRKSALLTWAIRPVVMAWANHMAGKRNLLGAAMIAIGVPVCRFIGRAKMRTREVVANV